MAIKTKAELFESVHNVVQHLEGDEASTFLEDVTDTFNSLESQATGDGTNWKQKYEENERMWRKRYNDRFVNNPTTNNWGGMGEEKEPEPPKEIDYDDLFKSN